MFCVLHFKNLPIFEQLHIEEALLRGDDRNWCIINEGSPDAIVMGISGKPEKLMHLDEIDIPVIKRYSGGGTVVVDENTIFVSLICKTALHLAKPYPEPIMRWSETLYKPVICHPEFSLRENDFVIGKNKCGGNAQYIKKDRWVHHTTFLWDYKDANMALLKMPEKKPDYRADRDHSDFVCRLKDHLPSKDAFVSKLKETIDTRYGLEMSDLSLIQEELGKQVRKSTRFIDVRSRLIPL